MTNTASSYKVCDIFNRHHKADSTLKRRGELGREAFEYALALLVRERRQRTAAGRLETGTRDEIQSRSSASEVPCHPADKSHVLHSLAQSFIHGLVLVAPPTQIVFQSDECWYMDTDDEDAAASVARRLVKLLKDLFTAHDDAALGLSPGTREVTVRLADKFRADLADNGLIKIQVPALPR